MTPITPDQLWGGPQPQKPLRLPPGMSFRAGPDKIGHLLPGRGAVARTHYLCGNAAIAERHAWPMLSRCPECVRRLEEGR